MGESFVELLFWIVVFIIFFFGFKKLQKRKEERRAKDSAVSDVSPSKTMGSD